MTASGVTAGVTFTVEPAGVRARAPDFTYLFLGADLPTIAAAYRVLLTKVRAHFGPRYRSFSGTRLDETLLDDIARRSALEELYVAFANRQPIDLCGRDWDRPQHVRRVVHAAISRKWPRNEAKVAALAAHLMALAPERYAAWWEGEQRYRDR